MNTFPPVLNDEETETVYGLISDFFGSMKADAVYHELTHPTY